MKSFYKTLILTILIVTLSFPVLSFNNVKAITDAEVESVAKHVKSFSYKYANVDDSLSSTFNIKKQKGKVKWKGKLKLKVKVRAVKGYRFRVRLVTYKYKLKKNKEIIASAKSTYHYANKSKDTKFKFKRKTNKNEFCDSDKFFPYKEIVIDGTGYYKPICKNNKYKIVYKNKNYYFKYKKAIWYHLQVKVKGIWQEIQ